jgi:hypothetical protein
MEKIVGMHLTMATVWQNGKIVFMLADIDIVNWIVLVSSPTAVRHTAVDV